LSSRKFVGARQCRHSDHDKHHRRRQDDASGGPPRYVWNWRSPLHELLRPTPSRNELGGRGPAHPPAPGTGQRGLDCSTNFRECRTVPGMRRLFQRYFVTLILPRTRSDCCAPGSWLNRPRATQEPL
jgi:hypothetical protein